MCRGLGFRGLGFRGLGFRGLGSRGLGFGSLIRAVVFCLQRPGAAAACRLLASFLVIEGKLVPFRIALRQYVTCILPTVDAVLAA